jgi:ParB-like chromosome segregation protein Spo0J
MKLEHTFRKMDLLKLYEKNPRTHNDVQLAALCESIEEFGFLQPIFVSPDNVIVAGHGRYMAAQKLGLEEVPVAVITGLTEAQLAAYRLIDNRLAEMGRWDFDILRTELESLVQDFDFTALGFDESALSALLQAKPATDLPEPDMVGDDDRTGRFILVYADEGEKQFWVSRCKIDGTKVVYVPADMVEKDGKQQTEK